MKNKYDVCIITVTTTVVFLIWKFIDTLFTGTNKDILLCMLGFISSVGTYKAIVLFFHSAIKMCEPVKMFFLGNEYLNGIWIGYYIGASGSKRYIVEYYEQDLHKIQIRGHSYNEQLELHSSWASTSVTIDEGKGKIFYTYSVNSLGDNINNIGCAEFDFERKGYCKYPSIIQGFSTDIQIGKRIKSYEEKLNDKKMIRSGKELDFVRLAFVKFNAMRLKQHLTLSCT
jgi:hypothetical protein